MLGLGHSTVADAVMYDKDTGTGRTELHPDDIAGIEAKYGPCEAPWMRLLPRSNAAQIAAGGTGLFRFDKGGWIYKHSGKPGFDWELIDESAYTAEIKCNSRAMFQRHENGQIWKYNTSAKGNWEFVDKGDGNVEMAPARGGSNLYQRHYNGQIWQLAPGEEWDHLGTFDQTVQLVANWRAAFIRYSDGKILEHVINKDWEPIEEDSRTIQILADDRLLYRLCSNGHIYSYPSSHYRNTWDDINHSGHPVEIAANGSDLIQRTKDGEILRYTGDPGKWYSLGNRQRVCQLAAGDGRFFYLTTDGEIWALKQ